MSCRNGDPIVDNDPVRPEQQYSPGGTSASDLSELYGKGALHLLAVSNAIPYGPCS